MYSEHINMIENACRISERCRLSSYSDTMITHVDRKNDIIIAKTQHITDSCNYFIRQFSNCVFDTSQNPEDEYLSEQIKIFKRLAHVSTILCLNSYYVSLFVKAGLPIMNYRITNHGDSYSSIPCTEAISKEKSFSCVVSEVFDKIDSDVEKIHALIVPGHSAIIFGDNPIQAAERAFIIERTAKYEYYRSKINLYDTSMYDLLKANDLKLQLKKSNN